jgi:release factor glutamine methyltransferase
MIPPHERRILEAHVRGVALNKLAVAQTIRPLNEYEERELKNLVLQRMKGFPLQYLTSSQGFYGRDFYVNTGALIPRPETEGLVELVLANLPPVSEDHPPRVLEFGTGSGAIALTLALERRDLVITATECSDDAFAVAHENAAKLRVGTVALVRAAELPDLEHYQAFPAFDLIVSNPPYLVESDEIAADVREHEPHQALFAPDEDPLYFYRFLAELAEMKLAEDGFGAFEIAEQRGIETAGIFRERGFETKIVKDLAERDRYLLIYRPGRELKRASLIPGRTEDYVE